MTFTFPQWMVDGARVLYDYDMAEIFERAIYNGLYFSILEQSMEGMLMPVEDTLDVEQRLTSKIDVIQFEDSMAAKATSTEDVMVVTVNPPQKGEIETHLFYAKAEYENRVEKYPGLKAAIDMQMKNQLVERKNLELTNGIFANKANSVTKAATGHLSYTDLLAMNADMAKRGYMATHFMTTHNLMADLLNDDPLHNTYNKMQIDKQLNKAYTAVWHVPLMDWTIVSTRWMDHADVGGTGYCVAWNFDAYVQEVIRSRPQARMYDRGDSGGPMMRGTTWWEEYGVGRFPASGGNAVAYMYVL
jgi:hypothetical protein